MQKYVAVTTLLAFYCAIRDTIRDFACSITSGVASVAKWDVLSGDAQALSFG